MSTSPNLQLPYLDANQNQKTVTHNAALRMLDALVNLHVAVHQAPGAADGAERRAVLDRGVGSHGRLARQGPRSRRGRTAPGPSTLPGPASWPMSTPYKPR